MDATSDAVNVLINVLELKMHQPHAFSSLEKKKIATTYITLANNFNGDKEKKQEFLKDKFVRILGYNEETKNFEETFKQKLINDHLQGNILDLHGLNYFAAKYLLNNCNIPENTKIIFDTASHTSVNRNIMKTLVDVWTQPKNLKNRYTLQNEDKVVYNISAVANEIIDL